MVNHSSDNLTNLTDKNFISKSEAVMHKPSVTNELSHQLTINTPNDKKTDCCKRAKA
jgi:hypothetical protein